MAELKTKPTGEKVENFINRIPDEQKRKDSFALVELMKQVTKFEPYMWGTSIIGFGTYHYKYATGHEGDCPVSAFSPRKQNLTVYLVPGFAKDVDLMQKLGKHSHGKSCLYFKRLSDIDMPTLKKLVQESFKYVKKKYS